MKFLVVGMLSAYLLLAEASLAQKPIIDEQTIASWPSLAYLGVDRPAISSDGRYLFYVVNNVPIGKKTLFAQDVDGTWKKEIVNAGAPVFTDDSRRFIYSRNDSLFIVSLSSKLQKTVQHVSSYQQPEGNNNEWLACQRNTDPAGLELINLVSDRTWRYDNVSLYRFNNSGTALLLQGREKKDGKVCNSLRWLDLKTNKLTTIFVGDVTTTVNIGQFNHSGEQVVFMVERGGSVKERSIWYYRKGMDAAVLKVSNRTKGVPEAWSIARYPAIAFSDNDEWLSFNLEEEATSALDSSKVSLDVWSYKDKSLQTRQLSPFYNSEMTTGIMNLATDSIVRTSRNNEVFTRIVDDIVFSKDNVFGPSIAVEKWWNLICPSSYMITNLNTGESSSLNEYQFDGIVSSDNRFLCYFDPILEAYCSRDFSSGKVKAISPSAGIWYFTRNTDSLQAERLPVGFAGWLDNSTLLVYDDYDIWKLDITGEESAVNLTNGYGRKHEISFRLIEYLYGEVTRLNLQKCAIVSAMNWRTKENGFYRLDLKKYTDPVCVFMAAENIYAPQVGSSGIVLSLNYPFPPVKAKRKDLWLVRRMAADRSPNLFVTSDFKKYARISRVCPENNYNWLSTEFVSWKQDDGRTNQGVLYKPKDFDSTKKYPIIFHYYEKMADRLNDFPQPESFATGNINIPYMVSRRYLVFTPDILYTIGHPGESALNAVVSGAKYLKQFYWVDSTRMGLQGHSHGGFETNYIVTHSDLFKAAMSGAGVSDVISNYGGAGGSHDNQLYYESGQGRIAAALWDKPNLYVENSPVFRSNKVNTPLLLMNNYKDENVPWTQGLEFFTALRRLQKPVWMLQYDDQYHDIEEKSAAKDYTIRVMQFFDHYLKGAPPPSWMTKGIPAGLKQIDDGLALDPQDNCSDSCEICKKKNYANWKPIPF